MYTHTYALIIIYTKGKKKPYYLNEKTSLDLFLWKLRKYEKNGYFPGKLSLHYAVLRRQSGVANTKISVTERNRLHY